jgi:thymidylate synthase
MVEEPVTITYTHPRERVLFNKTRDANVFFHLFESLWLLAGRNDVAPLAYYNSQIADIASDDGKTFNGAYGYRWRNGFREIPLACSTPSLESPNVSYGYSFETDVNQLAIIIDQLRRKPESRRCVLQMWNVEDDLLKIDKTKDVCCNTCVYFSLGFHTELHRRKIGSKPTADGLGGIDSFETPISLDMTVCNRSNDLIWGALGANVCHFSVLQEYVANCLGVEVGVYNQFTNNLHVYKERWEPEKWLAEYKPLVLCPKCHPSYQSRGLVCLGNRTCDNCSSCGGDMQVLSSDHWGHPGANPYLTQNLNHIPLVQDQARFDKECAAFIDCIDGDFQEPFLRDVAQPMMAAFRRHKRRSYHDNEGALNLIERVKAEDWKIAGRNWLLKRCEAWEKKAVISEGTGEVISPILEGK